MITAQLDGGLLILTINRPDKANALSEAMLSQLADAVEKAQGSERGREQVRVLVITGAGRVFSAGADLTEVKGGTLATSPDWERLSHAVAEFQGLSIAALNGSCAGGALGMVLACDLRIGVGSTEFFYPVIKIGVLPQPSDPARMVSLIGASATKRMLLTGARVDAREALSLGLLDQISGADLLADVAALAAPALAADPVQVAAIKALIGAPAH